MVNISQALLRATTKLQHADINSASLDAEILLSLVLHQSREYILAHPAKIITTRQANKFRQLISRRARFMPVAYLTGEKEFYGRPFYVDKRVLIPRPETEQIVDIAKRVTQNTKHGISIIDIGTGSGCIIITLAKELTNNTNKFTFTGIDISPPALLVARKNASRHRIKKTIKFMRGNLLEPIFSMVSSPQQRGSRNPINEILITANLPYLDSDMPNLLQSADSKSLKYEPKIALAGGKDGLKYYRELAKQIKQLLRHNPRLPLNLICEIGETQNTAIKTIFSFANQIDIKKDLAGLNRIVVIKCQNSNFKFQKNS